MLSSLQDREWNGVRRWLAGGLDEDASSKDWHPTALDQRCLEQPRPVLAVHQIVVGWLRGDMKHARRIDRL
eukprot:3077032-Rhodomonas_salina.3